MRFFLLFLFLVSIMSPLVVARGIGVSPSKINLDNENYFYIINSELKEVKVKLNSDVLEFEESNLVLEANSSSIIHFTQKELKNGFIKLQSGKGMLYEITIPVFIDATKKEIILKKSSIKSFYPVILFNLIVLVIGVVVWKKRSY